MLITNKLDLSSATVVDFPLSGEWVALATPAKRVPSHGTDYFGQRFAFDFVQIDLSGEKFYRNSIWRHFFWVMNAHSFLCWDAPVKSSFAGQVKRVGKGWPDRQKVNAIWELIRSQFFARGPVNSDFRPLTGNYVIIEGDGGSAMYGHLKRGSVCVREGDWVKSGDEIGRVGNSGNSTMPHLHFQFMSHSDPTIAEGMLCSFRNMEEYYEGTWIVSDSVIPEFMRRIRPSRGISPKEGF